MFVVTLRVLFGDPTNRPGLLRLADDRCKPHEWATRDSNHPHFPRGKRQVPLRSVHICVQPQKPPNCSPKKGGSMLGQTSPKAFNGRLLP